MEPSREGSIDLTGGPVWHLRALWRRARLWKMFRTNVETFLESWPVRSHELLLIGPSAGWCLPEKFLRGFSVVHAMDPDPFAAVLFRLNHPLARIGDWKRADFFVDGDAFLERHPGAAVLFCNVLGQRRYVNRNIESVENEMSQIKTRLRGRDWASFHDLLSGFGNASPDVKELKSSLDQATLLSSLDLSGEWLDHLTSDVFARSQSRQVMQWQFAPGRVHLVEAGFVSG
ncbi:MAG: hypothetical protein RIQ68_1790 [Pseudomonadota bacterium]